MPLRQRQSIKTLIDRGARNLNEKTQRELYDITKQLSEYAISRRNRALEAIKNRPEYKIPYMYREHEHPERLPQKPWRYENFEVTKDMSLQDLRHQFKVLKNYLETKSSTLEGYDKIFTDFKKRVEEEMDLERGDVTLSRENYNNLWKIYNRLEERNLVIAGHDSTNIQEYIINELEFKKNIDIDYMTEQVEKDIRYADLTGFSEDVKSYKKYMQIWYNKYKERGGDMTFEEFKEDYAENGGINIGEVLSGEDF